eukprot:s2753_g4.t1
MGVETYPTVSVFRFDHFDFLPLQDPKFRQDLELAQEKARMHFQHRREAETTLTLLEQQRAEVKRFQDLKAQKEALIVEAALFRLYCADRDATNNLEEAQEVREELSKTEHDLRKRRKAADAAEVRRQKLETEVREARQPKGNEKAGSSA